MLDDFQMAKKVIDSEVLKDPLWKKSPSMGLEALVSLIKERNGLFKVFTTLSDTENDPRKHEIMASQPRKKLTE